jgi:hypothetical protein
MGLFDIFKDQSDTNTVRFQFAELEGGITCTWAMPETKNVTLATQTCYIAHFFCIASDAQKNIVFRYLDCFSKGEPEFKLDPSKLHYNHKAFWAQIMDALSPLERHAADKMFNETKHAPVYYKIDGQLRKKPFSESVFNTKFRNGNITYTLKLGNFDKILLPLSIAMLCNHNFIRADESEKSRNQAIVRNLLERIERQPLSLFTVKSELRSMFQQANILQEML